MKLYIFNLFFFSLTGIGARSLGGTTVFNSYMRNAGMVKEAYCNYDADDCEDTDYREEDAYETIYDGLDIESIDRNLKKSGLNLSVNVKDMIKDITEDENTKINDKFKKIIKETLVGEIADNKNLMIMLITVVLMGSLFVNLSGSMGNGFISENGFYITYLIITAIMLTSFMITMDLVQETIRALLTMIKIIIPVYAIAVNFVGHAVTSAAMYEIIMIGIWLVEAVILNLLIPMIRFFVIVTLVNNLNKEDYFSKMCRLINNLVNWILKSVIFFIAGLNIIKSLIEPHIDMLGKNAVNRIVASLPSGTMVSVLTGTFLGAGVVVKNSIGIAGIILIGLIVAAPVIKSIFVMLIIRITSVILQPIGEKRYIEGLEGLAQGVKLLLLCLFSAVVLFVLTIAIMAFATNSTGGMI